MERGQGSPEGEAHPGLPCEPCELSPRGSPGRIVAVREHLHEHGILRRFAIQPEFG